MSAAVEVEQRSAIIWPPIVLILLLLLVLLNDLALAAAYSLWLVQILEGVRRDQLGQNDALTIIRLALGGVGAALARAGG